MKKITLLFLTACFFITANAQVNPGRSEQTTPLPIVDGDTLVVKPGAVIAEVITADKQIVINNSAATPGYVFTWYKVALDGSLKQSTITTVGYTETPTEPGYYDYKIIATQPATGCTSPISDIFRVLVLPVISATITSPITSVCAVPGSTVLLTANLPSGWNYKYQWTRNGVAISGATSSTYNVQNETTAGNVTFGVDVDYLFAPNTSFLPNQTLKQNTATKIINVITALAKPIVTP